MTQIGQMGTDYLYKELTSEIIRCFYTVYNKLGYGFLEKVYQNSMKIELEKQGFQVGKQMPIKVYYDTMIVGEYYADLVVEDKIILELKAAECLCEEHELQLINYLKATDFEIGLLLNFGRKPEIRRKIFTNEKHTNNTSD